MNTGDWVDATGHGFRRAMMDLDLAIIPLKEIVSLTLISLVLSFMSLAPLKIPTICSNVPPYSDEVPNESLTITFYETIKYYYIQNQERKARKKWQKKL